MWCVCVYIWTSLVAQMVKHLPTMWETRVRFLGQEDPLEREMATHSSIHAWKIPWTEKHDKLQFMGSQSWTWLSDFTLTLYRMLQYYSAIKRNNIVPFAELWMDLQTVIKSDVKSKREKQMSYNTIYMWDLEKCYRWTYLQNRNRETDVENKLTDTKGEGRVGWIGRWGLTHIHCYI